MRIVHLCAGRRGRKENTDPSTRKASVPNVTEKRNPWKRRQRPQRQQRHLSPPESHYPLSSRPIVHHRGVQHLHVVVFLVVVISLMFHNVHFITKSKYIRLMLSAQKINCIYNTFRGLNQVHHNYRHMAVQCI